MMEKVNFEKMVADFFNALRKKTLLIIIDTASKNEKAVFSLVSMDGGKMQRFSPMLMELGFKNYGTQKDLFVTYCAGRFSLFILDNIGSKLRGKGVELPDDFWSNIQEQHSI